MRIIELFAGIGACSKALKNLGIEYEIIDAVEIDKYAIASFNAIHNTNFEAQDITKWNKYFKDVDLIMHGSPCQDFSVAGKQAGGDVGSGTRSSLMYETIRIVGKLRPKYVVWENVKNLLSKKHKHNFDAYIETMKNLGYTSYYEVLNAKDYGIPQNRERVFTISIRNDINKNYKFPPKEELKIRLKNILEDEVDEKYYLSDKITEKIKYKFEIENVLLGGMQMHQSIKKDGICTTLTSSMGTGGGYIPMVSRKYGIFDTEESKHQAGSIYNKDGLAPTLNTMQGGWRQPCVEVSDPKIEVIGNYMPSGHDASRIIDSNGLAPTVKENYGTVTAITEQKIKIKEFNCGEFTNLQEYINYLKQILDQQPVEHEELELENGKKLRIRKLTPKECWRLMGFDDEDFEKAAKVNSNTQLYKQARKLNCGKSIRKNLYKLIERGLDV